jgi:hypothetical protein
MRLRKVKRPAQLGGVVADGESVLRGGLSPEGVFGWPANSDLLRIIVVLCGDCPASPPLSRLSSYLPPLSASLPFSRDLPPALPPALPPCPLPFPQSFPQSFRSPFPLRCPSSLCRHRLREPLMSPMTILILLTSLPVSGARSPWGLFPSPSHHASMADPPLREICPPAFRHDREVGVRVAPL